MIDETKKVLERKLRHVRSQHAGTGSFSLALTQKTIAASSGIDTTASCSGRSPGQPWPLEAKDLPPLQWWRTLPSDTFHDTQQRLLVGALKQIRVLHGGDDFAAALAGDPAAAIDTAFSLMPIEALTLEVDIAMTALLRCALERNGAAALVLAQIIGLTEFDHGFGTELAVSWLVHGQRCSPNPGKFSDAETVLLAAILERRHGGADA